MVVTDVISNRIKSNKYTSLEELLGIAEKCDKTLKKCA